MLALRILMLMALALGPALARAQPGEMSGMTEATHRDLYDKAARAYNEQDYAQAAAFFRQLIARQRRQPEGVAPELHYYLAEALSQIGRRDEARSNLAEFLITVSARSGSSISAFDDELRGSARLIERLSQRVGSGDEGEAIGFEDALLGATITAGAAAVVFGAAAAISANETGVLEDEYVRLRARGLVPEVADTAAAEAARDRSAGRTAALGYSALALVGAAATGGILLWIFSDDEGDSLQLAPTPAPSVDGAGLLLRGRF